MFPLQDSAAAKGVDEEGGGVTAIGGLAHRRLSIIDLTAAANQPMPDESGRYWICYNGEVFNYLELRAELEAQGAVFRTSSDTEVVLQSYIHWGEACQHRFNGMWALAVWDRDRRALWLSRDRFGIKPLFCLQHGGTFAFASEIKALLEVPGYRPQPNESAVADFLVHARVDSFDFTFFRGIEQVPAGHCMSVAFGQGTPRASTSRWWSLDEATGGQQNREPLSANAQRFRELFTDAVKLRLRSDVPVGTCLSGGVDSAAVVCVAAPFLRGASQNSFSARFPGFAKDETSWVELTGKQANIRQHWVEPDGQGLAEEFRQLLRHQEQPFGTTSIFAQWKVFQLARQHGVPVTLDGQGADEALAGYEYFFPVYYAELLGAGRLWKWIHEARCVSRRRGVSWAYELASTASGFLSHRRMIRLAGRIDRAYSTAWVSSALRRTAAELTGADVPMGGRLNSRLAEVFLRSGLPALLRYADRNSMSHAVEARMPFMDHRLITFLFALPAEHKLRDGQTKVVLREAMRDIVPAPILQRKDKIGFETPEDAWFREQFQPQLAGLFESPRPEVEAWVNMDRLSSLWHQHLAGKVNVSRILWRVFCLENWLREFM